MIFNNRENADGYLGFFAWHRIWRTQRDIAKKADHKTIQDTADYRIPFAQPEDRSGSEGKRASKPGEAHSS